MKNYAAICTTVCLNVTELGLIGKHMYNAMREGDKSTFSNLQESKNKHFHFKSH